MKCGKSSTMGDLMKRRIDKRFVFHVVPDGKEWRVAYEVCEMWPTKAEALKKAKYYAKGHHDFGGLSQVVVHDQKGKIQTEYTYGKDPRKSKG